MPKLTPKQKRFCEEYLVDLNATRAYKEAYPNVKKDDTAAVNASRMLRNAKVSEYINELMEKRSEETGITAKKVLDELEKVAFVDVELKGSEKLKALELLGKHLGMFNDKSNAPNKSEEIPKLIDALLEEDNI